MTGEEEFRRGIAISCAYAYEYESELCKIGVKYAGTPGEVRARDYILNKLNSFGLKDVHLEEFEYLSYMPTLGKLEIISPVQESITCEPLEYTANATAEGELIYAGFASKEEFEALEAQGVDFKGKIVIATAAFAFWAYPLAEQRGAIGFIVITDPPENLIRAATATDNRQKGTIPAVAISLRDGQRLLSLMSIGKVRVHLESFGTYSHKKSWNIIGGVSGTDWPEKKILICSHYDSQIKGQHAWDNTSGCAGVLELARAMAGLHPRRTIMFIFFGVEEQGLFWGSRSYVNAHRDYMKNYCAIVNTDGFSSALCPQNFLETTPNARDYALSIARELGWPVHYMGYPMDLSDHVPFIEVGIPAIWVHEGLIDPYYHTERDVLEHIDPEKLARITRMAGLCAFKLAYMEKLPF